MPCPFKMGLVGLVTQYYTRQDSMLALIPEKAGRQAEMEFSDIKFDKRLEFFAPCYSQSILMADFKENDTLVWFYKSLQKIRETRKLKSIYE